jgi:hypothetical protein
MENIQTQQLTLLARKALLLDEIKQIETTLGQLAAISQFIAANAPKPEPETQTEE